MSESPDYRSRWQARARKFPIGLRAVLFQGLPDDLNEAVHAWHSHIILNRFLPLIPDGGLLVDIGAGYGRLSQIIKKERPDLETMGLDFSFDFCLIYQQLADQAVCADIRQLPLADQSADGILVVTTLMYAPEKANQITQNICQILKPGGIALIIEPGMEIMNLLQRLHPEYQRTTTGGKGFAYSEFMDLFRHTSCTVIDKGSNIIFTLATPLLFFLAKFPLPTTVLANAFVKLDKILDSYGQLSLHRWVMAQRYV